MDKNHPVAFNAQTGASFFWMFLLSILVITGITFLMTWNWIQGTIFESTPPTIEIIASPKGIGSTAEILKVALNDADAGLDEVVIRYYKRGAPVELFREKLSGAKKVEKEFNLGKADQALSEGTGEIEIRVFDRSFYSNRAQTRFSLTVDQAKPHLELLSTQHNMMVGGSQLAFYKASDNNLASHGVMIAEQRFLGVPASAFDEHITDRTIYGVLFSPTLSSEKETKAKLFAEDEAGNTSTLPMHQRISDRSFKSVIENILPEQLAIAFPKIKDTTNSSIQTLWETSHKTIASIPLEPELQCALSAFKKMPGTIRIPFGATVSYQIHGKTQAAQSKGYSIQLGAEGTVVRSAAAGVVRHVGFLDGYGEAIIIDHGCGLKTVYSGIEDIQVAAGKAVEADTVLARLGIQALTGKRELLFETWLQSQPVDSKEWWDSSWTQSHIRAKINDVKKMLGLETGEW
jgi:murein DD-endopeptidase MepM/ murein hydrolase activator NlpD